jgi:hypothetical protein
MICLTQAEMATIGVGSGGRASAGMNNPFRQVQAMYSTGIVKMPLDVRYLKGIKVAHPIF